MKIRMQNGLPYVQVSLIYAGQHKTLDYVLLDTGSAGTNLTLIRVTARKAGLKKKDNQIRDNAQDNQLHTLTPIIFLTPNHRY